MDWSQEKRPFRLYTPLGQDVLLLNEFEGEEHLSQFYRFTVNAISKRGDIDAKELLLKPVHLAMRLPGGSDRTIYGIVSRLGRGGKAPYGYSAYEIEIVPAHWTLSLDTGFAIFQNKSARDICEELLKGTTHEWKMLRTLEPRPYCFRYRESRWNIIARLLEQEGVWFRYEHTSGDAKLILADSVGSAQNAWGVTKLQYTGPEIADPRLTELRMDAVPFVSETRVRTASEFLPAQNVGEMTPSAGAYKPPGDIKAYRFEQQMTEHRTGIDHGGGMTPGDMTKLQPDTKVYSRIRQELAEASTIKYSGKSRYVGLEAGAKVDTADHTNETLNKSLFVIGVKHFGSNGSYDSGDEAQAEYENSFEAIPANVPYRHPRVTPWPHVGGSHTGVVVGPPGEEIYTDKHGRVQVVMKWDRDNNKSLDYSCWIRVAQSFAGNRYGMVFLPRIGHEVMVEFLDGNPDNPIVVGSLYNAENLPPWELPDHKTQTGVRTHSTLKGVTLENYNELRFEDKIKEEQIYVQAEKNLDTLVKNDETRLVKHDRTTVIVHDDTKTVKEGHDHTFVDKGEQIIKVKESYRDLYVKKDNTITVDGNEIITVTMDRKVTVNQSQTHTIAKDNSFKISGAQQYEIEKDDSKKIKQGNSSTEVSMGNMAVGVKLGNIDVKADLGKITIEAMQEIELKVGQSSIVLNQMGVTIKGMMMSIEGQVMTEIKGVMTSVNGSVMLTLKGGITMIN